MTVLPSVGEFGNIKLDQELIYATRSGQEGL